MHTDLAKLEMLHSILCRQYSAWQRDLFAHLVSEHKGYLVKNKY